MKAIEVHRAAFFYRTVKALNTLSMNIYDDIIRMMSRIGNTSEIHKMLWLTDARETFEEYKHYKWSDETIKSKKKFLSCYPDDPLWFAFHVVNDEYGKMMSLNNLEFMLTADAVGDDVSGVDCVGILEWIRDRVREAIVELEKGTYNEKVAKSLPYKYRYGTILRKTYWDNFPESRKKEYGDVSEEERERFLAFILNEDKDRVIKNCIKDMTFRKYFEMLYPCYLAMEKEVPDKPERAFFRFAEDFGGGILEQCIDYDSPQDFDDFLHEKFGRWGGHPWGIVRGSSRTRIYLDPKHTENGYYFSFSGNPNWNIRGIIKSYLALKDAGVPFIFPCPEETIAYIKEEDLIGFVSCDDLPVYCQQSFPGTTVNDFKHYDEKYHKKIMDLIEWQPIEEVKLNENI